MLTPPDPATIAQLKTPRPQHDQGCQLSSLLFACSSNPLAHLRLSIDPPAYLYYLQSSFHLVIEAYPSQHAGSGISPSDLSVEHSQPPPTSCQEHTIERRCDHGQCHRRHVSQWVLLRSPCPPRAGEPQRTDKHIPPNFDKGLSAGVPVTKWRHSGRSRRHDSSLSHS